MEFKTLPKTPLYKIFSDVGKRIFLPEGIFYWSNRAKQEAEYRATLGAAYSYEKDFIDGGSSEWVPCYLSKICSYVKNLDISQVVPYSPISGIHELRSAWKSYVIRKAPFRQESENEKRFDLEKHITLPFLTNGVTNALFNALQMFLNPNEIVIVPNKRWGNYDNIIEKFLGGKLKTFEFFKKGKFNLSGLKTCLKQVGSIQEKIIIILNFPNNPTGYVPDLNEVHSIRELFIEVYNEFKVPILVLIDDAYEPYIFDKSKLQHSIFYEFQQLDEDIIPIKLDGVTKELLLYGARIGFITFGLKSKWFKNKTEIETFKEEIENKLSGMIRSTISNCNHFYQIVVQKLLKEEGISKIIQDRDKIFRVLKSRFELINKELKDISIPGISIDPNGGGFFLFINIDPDQADANILADLLLKKYKVGIIPICKPEENVNGIRIAYCSIDISQISEITQRIISALNEFRGE